MLCAVFKKYYPTFVFLLSHALFLVKFFLLSCEFLEINSLVLY